MTQEMLESGFQQKPITIGMYKHVYIELVSAQKSSSSLCCWFRFLARWGVLFETTKGPRVRYEPGTYDYVSGKLDRGKPVYISKTRFEKAREVLQLLGITITLFKLVLFADVLAGMSTGVSPVLQVALLLVLTVIYWVYMRAFAPPNELADLAVEIAATACDAGTFICGLVVALTPPGSFNLL